MRASALAALVAAACACACAQYQEISVHSQPSGAEVWLDKQLVGHTPLELRIDRTRAHAVYLKRDGYRPELVVLDLLRAPDGLAFLTPPDVEVRLVPGAESPDQSRDLEIEVEPQSP
jgi:hypothetical protein